MRRWLILGVVIAAGALAAGWYVLRERALDPWAFERAVAHEQAGELYAARKIYERLALRDHAGATMHLAVMRLAGRGMPADARAAIILLERAATLGLPEARFQLGELRMKARVDIVTAPGADPGGKALAYAVFRRYDLRPEPERAARDYLLAAEAGHAGAQFEYGAALEYGRGMRPIRERALYFYRLAAAQGHPGAMEGAARLEKPPAPLY